MLGHDDAGNRVAETITSSGTSTTSFYLTDEANPTGYAQPVEVWTSIDDNRSDASLQQTYILDSTGLAGAGDRVLAQADSSGTFSYLLTDGHGSTQQMTDASGNVTATFNYDAFGTAFRLCPARNAAMSRDLPIATRSASSSDRPFKGLRNFLPIIGDFCLLRRADFFTVAPIQLSSLSNPGFSRLIFTFHFSFAALPVLSLSYDRSSLALAL